uniref:Heat shock protein beta-1 n=1 Tax=Acartia pacifica TaxID=335913 RepID=R9TDY2_ACAPC|nr:heat shock protein beta-1 [Acartia pacifica]
MAMMNVPTTMRDFFFEDPHFQTNWGQFDRVKDAMFKESRDLWKEMDKDFRQARCMRGLMPPSGGQLVNTAENPLEKYEKGWMFPRRWMLPAIKSSDLLLAPEMELFRHGPPSDHDVIRVVENDSQLEVSLDTSHYKPEELKVTVRDNNAIVIEGAHEDKSEDGTRFVSRRFTRSYALPEGTKANVVSSDLSRDGVLVVKVTKGHVEPVPAVKNVEIKNVK